MRKSGAKLTSGTIKNYGRTIQYMLQFGVGLLIAIVFVTDDLSIRLLSVLSLASLIGSYVLATRLAFLIQGGATIVTVTEKKPEETND